MGDGVVATGGVDVVLLPPPPPQPKSVPEIERQTANLSLDIFLLLKVKFGQEESFGLHNRYYIFIIETRLSNF